MTNLRKLSLVRLILTLILIGVVSRQELCSVPIVQGFALINPNNIHHPTNRGLIHALSAKRRSTSKGFGKVKTTSSSSPSFDTTEGSTAVNTGSVDTTSSNNDTPTPTTVELSTLTGGQEALARLRRQDAERRDEELRAIREMRDVDSIVKNDPNAAVIPERVAQRMGKRMLPFVGIPLFGVMGTFVLFWYFATYKNMEFQPTLVAYSTIGVMTIGLLGITYSVMSASWDEDVEGSLTGVDEFKKNLGSVQEGLSRSRENLLLREKMSTLSDDEYDRAIRAIDKKEEKAMRKSSSLEDKLQKELEQ